MEGTRIPIFKRAEMVILNKKIDDIGQPLAPAGDKDDKSSSACDYTIDSSNQIWRQGRRIFAGLPTVSEIRISKKVICNGGFVYAGLSTGELVKVDAATRELAWTADIFAENLPTGGAPFLDVTAAPVYNGGFVYAGGLGGAFCKLRDSDGKKIWCLPVAVQEIIASTQKFNWILTTDGEVLAVSTDGKIYWKAKVGRGGRHTDDSKECVMGLNISDGNECQK
ncbi:MAG: PQQ-like beta-propeller repeat protein [Rickettsiales bacterium]|nr:PQQ-like beta-propeller repeat protein [Rickettsiales bacterium]